MALITKVCTRRISIYVYTLSTLFNFYYVFFCVVFTLPIINAKTIQRMQAIYIVFRFRVFIARRMFFKRANIIRDGALWFAYL